MIHKIKTVKKPKNNRQHKKTLKNKNNKHDKELNNIITKIEFDILMILITDQILLLNTQKISKNKIKEKIILLLKEIRTNNKLIKNTITDNELNIIFNNIYKFTILLNKNKKLQTKTTTYNGGFYFKNIEDKGDEPVTGNDIVRLLDEMQAFFYNAQYTTEGQFVQDPNTLISLLRGDTDAFKGYVNYRFLPKYYQVYPPFIKWEGIQEFFKTKKYEDLPDYLLAYQSYNKLHDEYLVEKGLKDPSVLNKDLYNGFYNKLANSLDQNIQKLQYYRGKVTGSAPLQLPL